MATAFNRVVKHTSRFFLRAKITNITEITNRSHGDLQNLLVDDHTQYLLARVFRRGLETIGRVVTVQTLVNSVVETALLDITVAAATLQTQGGLWCWAIGDYINNTAAISNLTVKARYGATDFWSSGAQGIPQGVTRRAWTYLCYLGAANATGAQKAGGQFNLGPLGSDGGGGGLSVENALGGHFALAIDSTVAQQFQLRFLHGTANAAIDIRLQWAILMYLASAA